MKAVVTFDMHGCPNRCRHCWLGHHRNPDMSIDDLVDIAELFKEYKRNGAVFFDEILFNTWYREPDFADNYRELWEFEKQLSTGELQKYELASIWRMVRDPDYAPWLREVGLEMVQVTLYGTQRSTDIFTGRAGAYQDILHAIDIMLENEIVPRLQIFPFTDTIEEIHDLCNKLTDIHLEERVNELGKELVCFLNTCTPLGEGYNLLDVGIRKNDIDKLPTILIEKTLKHFGSDDIGKLWQTEAELLPVLLEDNKPLRDETVIPGFMVDGDYNVYPNCGEIAPWWKLGNIQNDGLDTVIETYLNRSVPGLMMNYEVPVSTLAAKYGDKTSDRLWAKTDLVHKWIRMEGMRLSGKPS